MAQATGWRGCVDHLFYLPWNCCQLLLDAVQTSACTHIPLLWKLSSYHWALLEVSHKNARNVDHLEQVRLGEQIFCAEPRSRKPACFPLHGATAQEGQPWNPSPGLRQWAVRDIRSWIPMQRQDLKHHLLLRGPRKYTWSFNSESASGRLPCSVFRTPL